MLFPDPQVDSRAPDIVIEPELGVIYTNPSSPAIAEHGGFQDLDTHVPLLISNPAFAAQEIRAPVQTAQIAPTILRLLKLDPEKLEAIRIEGTQPLHLSHTPHLGARGLMCFLSSFPRIFRL